MAKSKLSVVLTGDERSLRQALDRIHSQQKRVEEGFEEVGKKGRRARKDTEQNFGASAQQQVAAYAVGLLSVAAAGAKVVEALNQIQQVRIEAGRRGREAEYGLASLQQLSGGDPQRLRMLLQETRALYAAGGAETYGQAAISVFGIESAGALRYRALFADLFPIMQDLGEGAAAAATIMAAMGETETGDIPAILSKGLEASKIAPSLMEDLLVAMTRPAAFASLLGLSDEEVFAGTAVLSKVKKSAPIGGTLYESLLTTLVEKGQFEGKPLLESLDIIAAMGMTAPEARQYFGRKEAFAAYELLQRNRDLYLQSLAGMAEAQETGLVYRSAEIRQQFPELIAPRLLRQQRAQRELTELDIGVGELLADAEREAQTRLMRERGAGEIPIVLSRAVSGLGRWLFGPEFELTGDQAAITREDYRRLTESEYLNEPWKPENDIHTHTPASAFQKLDEAGSKMLDAAERMTGGVGLTPANED